MAEEEHLVELRALRARAEELRASMEQARKEYNVARSALDAAEYEIRRAEQPDFATLDAAQLREYVADCARTHGTASATRGQLMEWSWRLFRRALAELAHRAGAPK